MSATLYRTDESFWFTNALVARGYHGWAIAPEEAVTDPTSGLFAMKLTLNISPACHGGADLRRGAPQTDLIRISGRDRYVDADGGYFELQCVCSVEPTSYSQSKGGFSLFTLDRGTRPRVTSDSIFQIHASR